MAKLRSLIFVLTFLEVFTRQDLKVEDAGIYSISGFPGFVSCSVKTRRCICTTNSGKATRFYQVSMSNTNYELQVVNDPNLCLHSYTSSLAVMLNTCDASYTSEWRKGDSEKGSMDNLDSRKLWCDGDGKEMKLTISWACASFWCAFWYLHAHKYGEHAVYNPTEKVKINGGDKYDLWLSCNPKTRSCIGTRDASKATIFYKIDSIATTHDFQLKMTDNIGLCLTTQHESYVNLFPCLYRPDRDRWFSPLSVSNRLTLKWDGEGRRILLGSIYCNLMFWKCKWRLALQEEEEE